MEASPGSMSITGSPDRWMKKKLIIEMPTTT
jgi:hypothetical protein